MDNISCNGSAKRGMFVMPGQKKFRLTIEYGDNNYGIRSSVGSGPYYGCEPEVHESFICDVSFNAVAGQAYEIQISDSGEILGSRTVAAGVASNDSGLAVMSSASCSPN